MRIRKLVVMMLILAMMGIVTGTGCNQTRGDNSLVELWSQAFNILVDLLEATGGDPTQLDRTDIIGLVIEQIIGEDPTNGLFRLLRLDVLIGDVYDYIVENWIRSGQGIGELSLTPGEISDRLQCVDVYR